MNLIIAFPDLMTYSYIKKIEPKINLDENQAANLEGKSGRKINLER